MEPNQEVVRCPTGTEFSIGMDTVGEYVRRRAVMQGIIFREIAVSTEADTTTEADITDTNKQEAVIFQMVMDSSIMTDVLGRNVRRRAVMRDIIF